MIKRIKTYKIPLLLTLFLFVIHFASKDYNSPYQRPIAGDAQAYYAYLPAVFIYGDLSYDFIARVNEKYYPESLQKSFIKPAGNGKVNKTFPGVALLYLPFFIIAHGLALLFGFDADGYSLIYQVLFDIGLWFYLLCGLIFFVKVLRKLGFSTQVSNWSMALILLGTNIVFYSIYDQSVTHIYNFFMINALVFYLLKFKEDRAFKWLGIALFLFALIGITRPTNVLVIGLIIFFIPQFSFYKEVFYTIIKPKNIWRALLLVGAVLSIPFILWKLQTGNWLVYSYGDEGFNFSDPYIFHFLFSYLKGWFTYTPFALLIISIGFIALFKQSKIQFTIGIGFYVLTIYIFSSWWCWYYGAGMSQRVMIDHYILLGYLLALILKKITESKPKAIPYKKILFATVTTCCILLNFAQAYQIRYGILSGGSATKAQYWDNFLVLEKRAQVYPHAHWFIEKEQIIDLNPTSKAIIKGEAYNIEGDWAIQVTHHKHYSASIEIPIRKIRKGSKLIIEFYARARHQIKETRAILDLDGDQKVFGLNAYLQKDNWVKIQYIVEPNKTINAYPILYFWNGGSQEKVEFKDLKISHYFSETYL